MGPAHLTVAGPSRFVCYEPAAIVRIAGAPDLNGHDAITKQAGAFYASLTDIKYDPARVLFTREKSSQST